MTAVIRDISERARLIEELSRAATQDSLTGLYNRRFITKILNKELERCRRFDRILGIAMIDLDNFKNINDMHGHLFGDKVLKIVAEILSKNIREVDVICRWGGEEFVVLLPETNLEMLISWAERVCKLLASTVIRQDNEPTVIRQDNEQTTNITASFGVMATSGKKETIDTLIEKADKALYRAKERGKNQVCGIE